VNSPRRSGGARLDGIEVSYARREYRAQVHLLGLAEQKVALHVVQMIAQSVWVGHHIAVRLDIAVQGLKDVI
jgi:hypothetical protein